LTSLLKVAEARTTSTREASQSEVDIIVFSSATCTFFSCTVFFDEDDEAPPSAAHRDNQHGDPSDMPDEERTTVAGVPDGH
jgi:hypothetical protein